MITLRAGCDLPAGPAHWYKKALLGLHELSFLATTSSKFYNTVWRHRQAHLSSKVTSSHFITGIHTKVHTYRTLGLVTMTSPQDPHTKLYSHINGQTSDLLDRYAVSELCKGWPVYRDASEWQNYRDLFTAEGAYVWTTWSGPRTVDEFISISKAGKEKDVFIMHRECGTLVELGKDKTRAIGKMKATITHRFKFSPQHSNGTHAAFNGSNGTTGTHPHDAAKAEGEYEFDVDCDCRFIFFVEKNASTNNEWKTRYVKLFYEKDKVVTVDGFTAPRFSKAELERIPKGYKYLGAAQARLGYEIDLDLPTASGELWDRMYGEMEKWLDGGKVDLFWEGKQ